MYEKMNAEFYSAVAGFIRAAAAELLAAGSSLESINRTFELDAVSASDIEAAIVRREDRKRQELAAFRDLLRARPHEAVAWLRADRGEAN